MGGASAIGSASAGRGGPAPMRSAIYWALLGLVIERPSYGYELAQRFEHLYGDVLPISGMSHIYAALQTLKVRLLIEELPVGEVPHVLVGRQPTPHYRATMDGVRGYRGWLIAQKREEDRRSELFARALAVFRCEPDVALDVLESCERECLREQANTTRAGDGTPVPRSSGNETADGVDDDGDELVSRLTREECRLRALARLSWIEYARDQFSTISSSEDRLR